MRCVELRWADRRRAGRDRGAALVLVVGVMFILMTLGTGTLFCGFQSRVLAARDAEQIVAKAAADAGFRKAVSAMNSYISGPLPAAVNEALPGCTASYSYTVTQNPDDTYSIMAAGTAGTATRTVGGTLKPSSPLWSGVMLNADVSLGSTSWIRSVTGSSPIRLRTNSTGSNRIRLTSNSVIDGDVMVGPGAHPGDVISLDNRSTITGTTSAAPQALLFPVIVPPAGLPNYGNVTINSPEVIASDRQYGRLTIRRAQVEIAGDVVLYVTGDLSLQSSAQLLVRDGSRLTLYLGGELSINNCTMAEVNQRPERLQVYGTPTCTKIDIKSSTSVCMAIYAPAAECSLGSSARLVGVFSGKSLSLSSSSELHYDPAVDGYCLYGNDGYKIDRWWEN